MKLDSSLLVEVVDEARALYGKAEELESPSVKQKIEQLNRILNETPEERCTSRGQIR